MGAGATVASSEVVIGATTKRGRSRRPPRPGRHLQREAQSRALSDQGARLPNITPASSISAASAPKRASSMDAVLHTDVADANAEHGLALGNDTDSDGIENQIHDHDHDHDELTRFLEKRAARELPISSPDTSTQTETKPNKLKVRITSKDAVEGAGPTPTVGGMRRGFRKSIEADFRMRLELDAKRGHSVGLPSRFAKWYELDDEKAVDLDLGRSPRWRSEDAKLKASVDSVPVGCNNLDVFQVKHRAKQSKSKTDVRKEAEREQRIATSSVKHHLQAMGGQRLEMRELRQSMHSVLRSSTNFSMETVANSSFMFAGSGTDESAEAGVISPGSPISPRRLAGVS